MRRRSDLTPLVLALALAAAVAVFCRAAAARAADAPAGKTNVVLIISDDHRWDVLGAAGNPAAHTPALDRLAREGVHFRQGTIHIPQCAPSRAMLLTGLPPHQNGWYSNQTQRPEVRSPTGFSRYPLLPALMRDAGYRTVLVGKWHVMPDPWHCGFTDVRVWMPGGAGPYLDAPKLAKGNSREFVKIGGYTNELFGTDAADFLRSDDAKQQPFFLWLALTAPHTPLTPNRPEVAKVYEGKADQDLWPPSLPKGAKPRRLKDYYEAVTAADRQVGHVLGALDETKLAENTLVIFIGDNGWLMGERPLHGQDDFQGKVYPYDPSVRVPFIARAPGGARGASEACVSSLDLPPTILRAAGVAPPKEWAGRDLGPLLRGEKADGFDAAVCEFPDSENSKFGDTNYRLVRTATHKLIDWKDPQRPNEFYDLVKDPHEQKNMINDDASRSVRDELRKRLHAWMAKTEDPAAQW